MEIINFEFAKSDADKFLAKFDVYLGPKSEITYPNFKVKSSKTGGHFITRPAYIKSEDEWGNKVWGSYPEMPDEKWKSLRSELEQMLKEFMK